MEETVSWFNSCIATPAHLVYSLIGAGVTGLALGAWLNEDPFGFPWPTWAALYAGVFVLVRLFDAAFGTAPQ